MKNHSRALAYLITVLIGLAMAVAVFSNRGGFSQPDAQAMYIALSDACFVPGVLLAGVGLLVLVANDGFFDILSYGVQTVVSMFNPFSKKERHKQFYDYKVEKASRRKKPDNVVLWVGLAFLAIAAFCLLMLSVNGYELLPDDAATELVESLEDAQNLITPADEALTAAPEATEAVVDLPPET